jgi:hypothetical protein
MAQELAPELMVQEFDVTLPVGAGNAQVFEVWTHVPLEQE